MNFRKSCPVAAAVCALLPFAATTSYGSSHREAPAITRMPLEDSTDFYLFNSYEPGRDGYVTLLANYIPLQAPYGGPNYFALDPAALYEIHIDNNGDAKEDITFQFNIDNDLAKGGKGLMVPVGPLGAEKNVAVPLKNIGGVMANSNNADTLNFNESYRLTMVAGDRRFGTRYSVQSTTGQEKLGKPYDYVGNKTF